MLYVYASLSRLGFQGLSENTIVVFEGIGGFSTAQKPTALVMHWRKGGHGGVCTGDGSSAGWGPASACSRWRIRVVIASSTVAVRRGVDRSGAASRVWAACRALRRSTSTPTEGSDASAPSCAVRDSAASSWLRRSVRAARYPAWANAAPSRAS